MEHSAYEVDILDAKGDIVGHKPRRDINKATDAYHSIYVFLITPDSQLILTRIPNPHSLPNLFTGRLGAPVATIRRSNENAEAAAYRAVSRELHINDAHLQFVGESMLPVEGSPRLITAYALMTEPPRIYSKSDVGELTIMSSREFAHQLHHNSSDISPSLQAMWEQWQERLPF